MSTALQQFTQVLRERGVSDATRQAYVSDVRGFLKANVISGVDEENAEVVAAKYIKSIEGTVVENTVKRRESAVRLFCKEVLGVDVLSAEPVERAPRDPEDDIWDRTGLPQLTVPYDKVHDAFLFNGTVSSVWTDNSLCSLLSDAEKKLFFDGRRKEQAKAFCDECAVKNQCLEFALLNGIEHGVWGGLDENERKAIHGKYVRIRRAESD